MAVVYGRARQACQVIHYVERLDRLEREQDESAGYFFPDGQVLLKGRKHDDPIDVTVVLPVPGPTVGIKDLVLDSVADSLFLNAIILNP